MSGPVSSVDGDDVDERLDVDDLDSVWRGGWTGTRDEQFTVFATAARPALERLAWLVAGDHHRAEELVQQTLVRTYTAWPRASAGDPMAYARRVLVNARTDTWRRRRREVLVADDGDGPAARAHTGSAAGHGEDVGVLERDVLVRALRRLSPRRRRVVVLRYVLDLTERQVADDLDVSIGTVKSTAARGLAQLREALEAPPGTPPTSSPDHDRKDRR